MFAAKNIYKLLFAINFLIILTVYYIEYGMGVFACKLCKYQRVPFFINLIILFFLIFNKTKFSKLLYILILSITINIANDLLKQLKQQGMSGCSEVTFRLFGLSLSTLNFLTNIIFLILCVQILRNENK